jgi:ribosomal protein L30
MRSPLHHKPNIVATLRALGLRKAYQTVYQPNIPSIRGQINVVLVCYDLILPLPELTDPSSIDVSLRELRLYFLQVRHLVDVKTLP